MRPATSRHDLGHGRVCLLTTAVVVVIVVLATFGPDVAEAWPTARYECYCKNCYAGYFICRNRNYSCNCAACSCYSDDQAAIKTPPTRRFKNAYMEALLQHFYGRRSPTSGGRRWVERTISSN